MTETDLRDELDKRMLEKYGPILSGSDLVSCLGYASQDALNKAVSRKTAPGFVFSLPNRRGRFALTADVAAWLVESRNKGDYRM